MHLCEKGKRYSFWSSWKASGNNLFLYIYSLVISIHFFPVISVIIKLIHKTNQCTSRLIQISFGKRMENWSISEVHSMQHQDSRLDFRRLESRSFRSSHLMCTHWLEWSQQIALCWLRTLFLQTSQG